MTFYVKCKHFDGRDMWVVAFEGNNGIGLHLDILEATLFTDHSQINTYIQSLNIGLRPYATKLQIRLPFMPVIAETATGIWPAALKGLVS